MLILLAPPANNERGPRYMEKALAAIHQTSGGRQPLTLIYGRVGEQIGLMVRCSQAQRELVLGPISANYPQCRLAAVEDEPPMEPVQSLACDVRLAPEMFPILRHAQFEDLLNQTFADPVSSLLRAIRPEEGLDGRVEITVYPASHARCHHALRSLQLLDREFFRHHHRLAAFFARHITRWRGWWIAWILGRIAARSAHPALSPLETSHQPAARARARSAGGRRQDRRAPVRGQPAADRPRPPRAPRRRSPPVAEHVRRAGGVHPLAVGDLSDLPAVRRGPLPPPRPAVPALARGTGHAVASADDHRRRRAAAHQRLHGTGAAGGIPRRCGGGDAGNRPVPGRPPAGGTEPGGPPPAPVRHRQNRDGENDAPAEFARRRHRGGPRRVPRRSARRSGRGGAGPRPPVPHQRRDLSRRRRHPADRALQSVGLPAASRIDLVTSGVVSAFKKLHDSWGPRLEDTLRNAVYAVVEQGGTLVTLTRLLGEKAFRERFVANIRDEVVRAFWRHEFAQWSDAYRTEAVAAIQNKIRPFLTNTTMRAIVSRPGPSLDLREIMDAGQVLIVNLSKGRVGEDNATLLGALLVTSLQQAAMTRADQPEGERRDFFLYVDEFQNFTTGSFAAVLSEARKFRLSLIVAHQYLAQLPEPTADAVWGNVGSLVAFQVGSDDAQTLALQLSKFPGQVAVEHLTGLPKYTAYARLLVDGLPSSPFSIRTLPPEAVALDPERAEIIRRVVQRRFSAPAQDGLAA